jgi:hypothetical protein
LVTNIIIDSIEPEKVELTKISVKALLFSLPYAAKCFQIESDRNFIMSRILAVC